MRTQTLSFRARRAPQQGAALLPSPAPESTAPDRIRAALDAAILPGLAAALGYGTVAQGGFYPAQAALVAGLALALGLAAAANRPALLAGGTLGFGFLLGGLTASAVATGWPAQTVLPAAGLASALGAFLAGRRLVERGDRETLARLLAWLGSGVGLLGLAGLAFHRVPWAMFATHLWRAASTLTYANAAGGLLLLTLPATLLLPRRTEARLAAYAIFAGLLATLSRGAIGAAVVFGVVVVALGHGRRLADLARPFAGAAIAMLALLPSVVGPARPAIGLAGIAAGAAVAAVPLPRRAARMLGGIAAVVATLALAAVPLVAGPALPRLLGSRVDLAAEPRFAAWGATIESALEHPTFGTGPGTFMVTTRTGQPIIGRFAHNEYVQALAETGMVGLGSIVLAAGSWAAWVLRRRHGPAWAIGVATCAAFLAHSAVDFIWRFPVLVALAFLWLAVAGTRAPMEVE